MDSASGPLHLAFVAYSGDLCCHPVFQGISAAAEDEPGVVLHFLQAEKREWRRGCIDHPLHGIITADPSEAILGHFGRLGVPVVSVARFSPPAGTPWIWIDPQATAALAVEHLLGLHVRQAGVIRCGNPELEQAVVASLQAQGLAVYQASQKACADDGLGPVAGWPRPLGLFCSWDMQARQIIRAARTGGLRIPDDLAVLGCGNLGLYCSPSPSLSSLELPLEEIGVQALKTLLAMVRRQPVSLRRLPPRRVIERQSTRMIGVEDPLVRDALLRLRGELADEPRLARYAADLGCSGRTLDRHFQTALGQGFRETLNRLRLDQARRLLRDPHRPLRTIAAMTGFRHLPSFIRSFRARHGLTPGAYRALATGRDDGTTEA